MENKEIIENLNVLTSHIQQVRVVNWGQDFHDVIRRAINPHLKQYDLEYHTWWVSGKNGEKVFCFDHEFKKDARSASWNKIGKVSNIEWKSEPAFSSTQTLSEGFKLLEKQNAEMKICVAEEQVKNAKQSLLEAEKYLNECIENANRL